MPVAATPLCRTGRGRTLGRTRAPRARLGISAENFRRSVGFLVTAPPLAELGYVIPENAEEQAQVHRFMALPRQGLPVPPGDPVLAFVQSRTATRPVALAGRSTVFSGAAGDRIHLRQNGGSLVLLEVMENVGTVPLAYRVAVVQQ